MRARHFVPTMLVLALLAIGVSQGGMRHGGAMRGGGMHGPGMDMPLPSTELEFLQHMIVHHREAVESAEQLLERTERPELQEFLEAVIETQSAEIELMSDWIESRYPDADVDVPYEPMMRDLEGAPVAEQEQAFLEDMIVHHMGAVRDAQALLSQGLAEHEDVADLARRIVSEQRREMQLMRDWLVSWFEADPMPGMMQRQPADEAQNDDRDSVGVAGRQRDPMGMGTMPGMHGMPGMGGMRPGAMPMGMQMRGMMPCPGPMGMGMHGMGMRGMGMGMHGMGMHGMGMHGMGMGGMGMRGMEMPMPGMHPFEDPGMPGAVGYPPHVLVALARAFLAGEGVAADEIEVDEIRTTFEIVVRHGDAERVLVIDADTGRVRESTDR